jgi:8-oxo-dGTP pyrophosphatase MutT (NUDIX family)
MNFPVSIKGVLVEAGRVVLLENERDEWELPGGRLEPRESLKPVLFVSSPKNWVLWWRSPVSSTAGCTRFCLNGKSSSSPTV